MSRKIVKFIIEKNEDYVYAEKHNNSNSSYYKVFNGKFLEKYSEDNFNSCFYPYKSVRLSTFLRYANSILISHINTDQRASYLYSKIEAGTVDMVDIFNIIRFYEINIKPFKEDVNHEEEYNYLKTLNEGLKNDFSEKQQDYSKNYEANLEMHKDLKRVYTNM